MFKRQEKKKYLIIIRQYRTVESEVLWFENTFRLGSLRGIPRNSKLSRCTCCKYFFAPSWRKVNENGKERDRQEEVCWCIKEWRGFHTQCSCLPLKWNAEPAHCTLHLESREMRTAANQNFPFHSLSSSSFPSFFFLFFPLFASSSSLIKRFYSFVSLLLRRSI